MANKCKECGCSCKRCISSDHDVQLHVEIENLTQRLLEKEMHIVRMETNFLNEANKFPSGELVAVREELLTWQDKYKRLYEGHRRIQRVNQGLEDKLLKLVDACETEKNALTKDVATLSHKLAEANYAIKKLTDDNERYKNDVSLAIQFLQCKQSNFVAHKFDSLPSEVQSQVANHMVHKKKPEERKLLSEVKSIKVPIPTFPPTAMVYSVPKSPRPERKIEQDVEAPSVDIVSAAIMAKVLEERQKEKALAKHCDTCTCAKNFRIIYDSTHHSIGTQTGDYSEMLCLRCNENIQVTSVGMKIVKNSDFKTNKNTLISHEPSDLISTINNVVKVQPNNFLNDNKSDTISKLSNPKNLHKSLGYQNVLPNNSVINPNYHMINKDLKTHQHLKLTHSHKLPNKKKLKVANQLLKEESLPLKSHMEMSKSEENVSETNVSNTDFSISQTRNILLDNAHSNVTPVLYAQNRKMKIGEAAQAHDLRSNIELASNSAASVPGSRIHQMKSEAAHAQDVILNIESVSGSGGKSSSVSSEIAMQNQQRVAEWIQNNLDNDVSSSENSRTDSVKSKDVDIDKVKYAKMEENVKRFLFGESEFLKKVEIGKLKYQNLQDVAPSNNFSKKDLQAETDI